MGLIDLDWYRDGKGYRIEDRPEERSEPATKRGQPWRWFHTAGMYIVRNGGQLQKTTPLKCDGLWRQLADCRTPEGALEFVNRWGFLQRAKGKQESLGIALGRSEMLRRLAEEADREEWGEIARSLDNSANSPEPFKGVGKLAVTFDYQEGMERPELRFRPPNLGEAIHVQALLDISGNTNLRKCANPACPEWFKYGPGTAHRETAMYCSPKCQGAHAYAKRKESQK